MSGPIERTARGMATRGARCMCVKRPSISRGRQIRSERLSRSHECERCTQECVRHNWFLEPFGHQMPIMRFEALAKVKFERARIRVRHLQADGGETARPAPFSGERDRLSADSLAAP